MKTPVFKRLVPGVDVRYRDSLHHVVDVVNTTQIIVESDNGQRTVVRASDVTLLDGVALDQSPDLAKIDQKKWLEAVEIYESISSLVAMGRRNRCSADVEAIADKVGKHRTTIYRWLELYEQTGLVSSLLRKKRADTGKGRISNQVEAVIKETIEQFHLTPQRRTPTKTAMEVRKICIQAGLPPPDEKTVRNRINALSGEVVLRKREGAKAAAERFTPLKGSFPGADYPLSVVQIDHTPMDVIVVDDVHRKPINRPWLTTAIDVYSRMVVGFYISLDPPGTFATGMCISMAILGKEIFLSKLNVDLSWPCWGVMKKIHTDNAKEFRGTMLGRAAIQYGIIQEHRPKGRPHFGGHVERAFRTHMAEIHNELPGTTFSNVRFKRDYDSEARAVMTLDALEHWFTLFILGVYHQNPHSGIAGLPPIVKWELGIRGTGTTLGTGIPMRFSDEDRLKLDFMPYFERTVQEYGIQIEGISYWTDALRRLVHIRDPKHPSHAKIFICRYDPRDISSIWLYDDETNQYIEVPYRNLSRPAISMWELRKAKSTLREQSKASTNEELIFQTVDQMRAIVVVEAHKTKTARRMQQRKRNWDAGSKVTTAKNKPVAKPVIDVELADFDDILPFDQIRES
jgi:putative transposase